MLFRSDEILIENANPIPLIEIIAKVDTYGTKNYGSGLYSAIESFQINRVSYKLSNEGSLTISLQIGQLRPSIAESLSQLEFKIDQVRQQGV